MTELSIISELTNPKKASKMSILNLFFQMLTNAQPCKPAPCLASCPFSPIFVYFKCSQNAQIKNPKSCSQSGRQNPKSLTDFVLTCVE